MALQGGQTPKALLPLEAFGALCSLAAGTIHCQRSDKEHTEEEACSPISGGLLWTECLRGTSEVEKIEKKGGWNSWNREQTTPQRHQGGTGSDLGSKYKVVQCPWSLGRAGGVRGWGNQS